MNKKVVVAMSGGVDSSVAAALLQKEGYRVTGMFLNTWFDKTIDPKSENRCCSLSANKTAGMVAHKLGIRFEIINALVPFKQQVVDYFLSELKAGQTPNPCIPCNKFVRFEYLLDHARSLGADYLATGHYMRLNKVSNQIGLFRGIDLSKDQSYFHYTLTQKKLKKLLFPIGDYKKTQVKQLAKKFKISVADREESQDLCFIPKGKYSAFLNKYLNLKPGQIVTTDGKMVGEHQGLPLYTLGQREGLGIGGSGPYYVVKKDKLRNKLVVAKKTERSRLFTKSFKVKQVNFINGRPPKTSFECLVQTRHRQKAVPARLKASGSKVVVEYKKPQMIVTPGQSAVWYQEDQLIGGGVIVN